MSTFPKLTDAGRAMLLAALAGNGITFTKFKIGSGAAPKTPNTLTDLVHAEMTADITEFEKGTDYMRLGTIFDNTGRSTGFQWTEIGVFAKDNSGAEKLYAYCNTGNEGEYIPPLSSGRTLAINLSVFVTIGEAANVTVQLGEGSIYATKTSLATETLNREIGDSATMAAAEEALRLIRLHREQGEADIKAEADERAKGDTKTLDDAKIHTTEAVAEALSQAKKYAESLFASNDALVFKGTLGTAGTAKALPTNGYSAGWLYWVVTAGEYAGETCEIHDLVLAVNDYNASFKNSDWTVIQTNINGAVVGPASAVDKRIAVFDGTTGKLISNGGKTIAELTAEQGKNLDIVRRSTSTNVPFLNTENFTVKFDGPAKTVTIEKKATAKDNNFVFTLTETDDKTTFNHLDLSTVTGAIKTGFTDLFSTSGTGEQGDPFVITAIKPFAFGFTVANTEQYHGNAITLAINAIEEKSGYLDQIGAVHTAFFCGPVESGEYVWAGPWVEQSKVVDKAAQLGTARKINDTEFDGTRDVRLKNSWNYVVNESSSTVTQRYITFTRTGSGKATVLVTVNEWVCLVLLSGTSGYQVFKIADNGANTSGIGSFKTHNSSLILHQTGRPCMPVYFTVLGSTYTTLSFTPHSGTPTPTENAEVRSLAELPIGTEDIGDGAVTAAKLAATVSSQLHTHSNKTVLDGITINQITNWNGAYDHSQKTDNPHKVSKAQVSLGNVDNTADKDKPVSGPQETAMEFARSAGVEALRGVKLCRDETAAAAQAADTHAKSTANPHKVSRTQVGLGNVDNTADKDKPVSNPQVEYINRILMQMLSAGIYDAGQDDTAFAGKSLIGLFTDEPQLLFDEISTPATITVVNGMARAYTISYTVITGGSEIPVYGTKTATIPVGQCLDVTVTTMGDGNKPYYSVSAARNYDMAAELAKVIAK